MSQSVAPSDSVSSTGRKKSKPGKSQRQSRREGTPSAASAQTAPASMASAAMFARGASFDATPQPGKFPIVFQSGAGEPTKDSLFAVDPAPLVPTLNDLSERYVQNSKYSEFAANASVEQDDFDTKVVTAFLLGLAQQVVHAHVNMGLPQGDFSPLFSSDVWNFSGVRSILAQFGEYAIEALGTRYLLCDYASTVRSIVHAAKRASTGMAVNKCVGEMWLPMSTSDKRTKLIVAAALSKLISQNGITLDVDVLANHVFSGEEPDYWHSVKQMLGSTPSPGGTDLRDRFDFLFKSYKTEIEFATLFNSVQRRRLLKDLNLTWDNPDHSDMSFSFNAKTEFSNLADEHARSRASYAKFFSCGSGVSNRAMAAGSPAQMASVSITDAVVIVRSHIAIAAPQFSLAACFPCSGIYQDKANKNVVVTTSLSVKQRATEFLQLDWL